MSGNHDKGVKLLEEEFGAYNFGFTRYIIKKMRIEDQTLIIDGINGFTTGKLLFEDLGNGCVPDERMIGEIVFGIKQKELADDYVLFRIFFDSAEIEYSDIIARNLIYKL